MAEHKANEFKKWLIGCRGLDPGTQGAIVKTGGTRTELLRGILAPPRIPLLRQGDQGRGKREIRQRNPFSRAAALPSQ
jgi:hypothetical protein